MSDHSLQNLLLRLEQGNVTHGWGAILAFSREQLNRLLAQQYIDGLEGLRFLLPFSERFFVNTDNTEEIVLRGIVLGAPILSFEHASLNKSSLTLTLNIIGGSFTNVRYSALAPPSVMAAFTITEDMGFHVRMEANLNQAFGEVDKRGRVAIDLSIGEKVVCNLGSVERVREQIGQYFQRYFAGQPEQQRRFTLGIVELNSYNPLSPTAFAVRSQPAPGAGEVDSDRYGEGAVVVFIRLKVQDGEPPAGLPIEGSGFPYLIPDDVAGGMARYSAALLVSRQYRSLVDEEQLTVLKNMMFPGENLFEESNGDRYTPYDLVLFGNVALKPGAAFIEPSSVELSATKSQQFVVRRGDGSVISSVLWDVSSPDYPTSVGTVTPGGVYTATAHSEMRRDRLPIVVTARYRDNGQEKVASALVHERFESINVAPLIQIKDGADPAPITLHATTSGPGRLGFRLLEPSLGARLEEIDANHQTYHPPTEVPAEPLVVQSVEVWEESGTGRAQTSILLVNKPMFLGIEPHYVTGLAPGGTVQLQVTNDGIEPEMLSWRVIGDGEVDGGLFTAPEQGGSLISVVVCELPNSLPGIPTLYGYSVINRQPVQNEYIPIRWEELNEFSIEAPGGLVQCYANGLQQIPIVLKLETMPLEMGGQPVHIPVSDVELSKLRLVDQITGQVVPFVDSFQEGIEYGSPIQWAAHVRANRFSHYSPTLVRKPLKSRLPAPRNNGTRYRELYIHMAVASTRTFYAEFQADDGRWWRSDAGIIGGNGTITVTGIQPPTKDTVVGPGHDYDLVRKRVFSGEGNSGPEGNDEFNYYLDSVDYWRLSYKRLGAYPVSFATLEVEGNISTVQWESEALEEVFFSYTGFAFYPTRFNSSDAPPTGLSFDIYYRALLATVTAAPVSNDFHGANQPSPGELLVSLHRVADMPYWHDSMANGNKQQLFRQLLDRPVTFVLLDEEGNRHRLQIGFQAPSLDDSRNLLTLNIQ